MFLCVENYILRVCFYSVLFLLLIIILFIFSCLEQVIFATFDPPEMRDGRLNFLTRSINLAALMRSGFVGGWLKISSVHGKKVA